MFVLLYSWVNYDDKEYGASTSFFNTEEEAIAKSREMLKHDLKYSVPKASGTDLESEEFFNKVFNEGDGTWEIEQNYVSAPSKVEIFEI